MSNPEFKLVNFYASTGFRDFFDRHYRGCGYSDKSQFIRDAIREKLLLKTFEMPLEFTLSPSRTGKGGKPTHAPKPVNSATSKSNVPTNEKLAADLQAQVAKLKTRRPV